MCVRACGRVGVGEKDVYHCDVARHANAPHAASAGYSMYRTNARARALPLFMLAIRARIAGRSEIIGCHLCGARQPPPATVTGSHAFFFIAHLPEIGW